MTNHFWKKNNFSYFSYKIHSQFYDRTILTSLFDQTDICHKGLQRNSMLLHWQHCSQVSRDLRFMSLGVLTVALSLPSRLASCCCCYAIIQWEDLCTLALDQNASQKDSRLLLLLLLSLLHVAESFGRS